MNSPRTNCICENPERILQDLIRFNTTNPPGNERECIEYIAHLLDMAGIPYHVKAQDENRPNLIARLKGSGQARPLLLQGTEKQICWLEARITGPGGHGSIPLKDGAMARAADLIQRLHRTPLTPHITPVVRQMIETIAAAVPAGTGFILHRLLNPSMTGLIVKLLGKKVAKFVPLPSHTANPTIISGGDKINVIPSEIRIQIDGRILPGFSPSEFLNELQKIAGRDVTFDIIRHDPGPGPPDMGMFGLLADVLRDADPKGTPVPMLLPGVTDGRHFARLGIQTYGFTPMNLPPDFNFFNLVHAADERIPVDALRFGADAVYELLRRYRATEN